MRIWFDTEFYEDGRTIDLISIGLVRDDGAEYYAETVDAHYLCNKNPWLVANVRPHLLDRDDVSRNRSVIAQDIVAFAGESPEFWAYYADYDWVVLCQLYGRMIDLPKGWPMYCRDLQQEADRRGLRLPQQTTAEHNALNDARWTRNAHAWLESQPERPPS